MAFWDKRQGNTLPIRPLRIEPLAAKALRKVCISTGRYAEYPGITRREWLARLGISVSISVGSSWKMAASGVGLRALAGSNGKESKEAGSICTPIAMVQQSWKTTPT